MDENNVNYSKQTPGSSGYEVSRCKRCRAAPVVKVAFAAGSPSMITQVGKYGEPSPRGDYVWGGPRIGPWGRPWGRQARSRGGVTVPRWSDRSKVCVAELGDGKYKLAMSGHLNEIHPFRHDT